MQLQVPKGASSSGIEDLDSKTVVVTFAEDLRATCSSLRSASLGDSASVTVFIEKVTGVRVSPNLALGVLDFSLESLDISLLYHQLSREVMLLYVLL
jgi:hypothetical protein